MKPLILAAAASLVIPAQIPSTPDLGKTEGRCRMPENGPAFIVTVKGLKDRRGLLKLEVYPDNDDDFLADDNLLIASGKVFRRVEQPTPATGPVTMCVRLPHAGRYSVSLLHDRDTNRKFGLSTDGIGFASNPRLGLSKPRAAAASAAASDGPTSITIVMNYRQGLFSFGPMKR